MAEKDASISRIYVAFSCGNDKTGDLHKHSFNLRKVALLLSDQTNFVSLFFLRHYFMKLLKHFAKGYSKPKNCLKLCTVSDKGHSFIIAFFLDQFLNHLAKRNDTLAIIVSNQTNEFFLVSCLICLNYLQNNC